MEYLTLNELELIREALSFYINFQEGQPDQFKLPGYIYELREVESKIIELREVELRK